MTSRMPSGRRAARPAVTNEDSSMDKKSGLPQLTRRPVKTVNHVSASCTSTVGSSTSTVGSSSSSSVIPTRANKDKTAMPPPRAPLTRPASIVRSGSGLPSRSASTRVAASSLSDAAPKGRVVSHGRTSSTSTLMTRTKADGTTSLTATASSKHVRSQSSTTFASGTAVRRPNAPTVDAPLSRPAFNTLQQDYSPAKTTLPKPSVPLSRTLASLQDKNAPSFDTIKLQCELLYLSTLHESAQSNLQSYKASAMTALRAEFDTTRQQVQQIRKEEEASQEQANLMAMAEWLGLSNNTHMNPEAAETIQHASGCLNELTMLSAPESKYTVLVEEFSLWAAEAMQQENAHLFSGPLPPNWHHMHASISQRLRLLESKVDMLPPAPPSGSSRNGVESSLVQLLACMSDLVAGIKHELQVMLRLEQQVVSTEKERVMKAVASLPIDAILQSSEEWTAAW